MKTKFDEISQLACKCSVGIEHQTKTNHELLDILYDISFIVDELEHQLREKIVDKEVERLNEN